MLSLSCLEQIRGGEGPRGCTSFLRFLYVFLSFAGLLTAWGLLKGLVSMGVQIEFQPLSVSWTGLRG